MALTYNQYEADGLQTDFVITFPYLNPAHVKAYIDTVWYNFTWVNSSTIRFSFPPNSGAEVHIRRETPFDSRMVEFFNGALLTEDDHNLAILQVFYAIQELNETAVFLRGPQGAAGSDGADGSDGPQGPPGVDGATIEDLLTQLNGTITEDHLYNTLKERIDYIDIGGFAYGATEPGILESIHKSVFQHEGRVYLAEEKLSAAELTWFVKLQIDGEGDTVVAGVGLNIDPTVNQSEFMVLADKFKVVNPSLATDKQQVFTVGTIDGTGGLVGINGDLIVDGTIRAGSLVANSITTYYLAFNNLAGLNATEGAKLTGIEDGATKNVITRSTSSSPPSSPTIGDLWYQSDTLFLMKYTGGGGFSPVAALDAAHGIAAESTSYVVSAGANRYLILGITEENPTGGAPTATFGGQSMTQLDTVSNDNGRITILGLNEAGIAAASGSSIVVTGAATGTTTLHVRSFENVHQTTPVPETNSNWTATSTPNPLTTSITTGDSTWVLAVGQCGNADAATWGSHLTERTDVVVASTTGSMADKGYTTGQVVTCSVAWAVQNRSAIIGIEIAPAPASGWEKIAGEVDWDSVSGAAKPADFADVTLSAVEGGLVVTGGGITLSSGGSIKGGQTAYATGTGFFLGYSGSAYKFSIGSDDHYMRWDGSSLSLRGNLNASDISGGALDVEYLSTSAALAVPQAWPLKITTTDAPDHQSVLFSAQTIILTDVNGNMRKIPVDTEVGTGPDADTVLLLHLDNNYTDESDTPHTVTNYGTTFDTTHKVFGTHCLYFDGVNDYLSIPDSADWDFSGGNFTVEARIHLEAFPGVIGNVSIFSQYQDANNNMHFYLFLFENNYYLGASAVVGGVGKWSMIGLILLGTKTAIEGTTNHVAWVQSGDQQCIFWNGVRVWNTSTTNRLGNYSAPLMIGWNTPSTTYFHGYMDEIRISKTARWTTNFTPPGTPYAGGTGMVCDLGNSGAGGLDTGSIAINTGYYLYFIYNSSTGAVNTLASLSATAPTLPSGYDFYARVGWCTTDATGTHNIEEFTQIQNRYAWDEPVMLLNAGLTANITAPLDMSSSGLPGFPTLPAKYVKEADFTWYNSGGSTRIIYMHPRTFANTQTLGNGDTHAMIGLYPGYPGRIVGMPIAVDQTVYVQSSVTGYNTIWITGFTLQ